MKPSRLITSLLVASASAHPLADHDVPAAVEEFEGQLIAARQTCGPVASNPTTWWRALIGHNGTTPYSTDPTFQYYRTVVQYGAVNNGTVDASAAFNYAINAWSRAGNTQTTRPAYVYVPPGTYLIANSIQMLVNTFLIGDPLDPPTLIAAPSLGSNPVILGYDSNQGQGSATKNFYMAVRNLIIKTTSIPASTTAVALDWSVAQGCSLTNMQFIMPDSSNHIGVNMSQESSGTIISDSSFNGGHYGIQLYNQQYMLKGLSFNGCNVGIYIESAYVVTIQGATFQNCDFGVDMGRAGVVGAVSIVDSSVSTCNAGVNAYVSGNGEGSLVLDNFQVSSVGAAVKSPSGATLLPGSVPAGQTWVMGNESPQNYQSGTTYPSNRPSALLSNGKYFTMPIPQYQDYDISQFISIKGDPEYTVYGDNEHDDGPAINAILLKYANCKIVFFEQGIYKTAKTIYVPGGSRIVGEVLSVISGNGSNFYNPANPQPIIRVGNPGEVGVAQFTDMLFSTADVLQGAIVVEVNMAGANPGDVGFWNTHIRVGGSIDSKVSTNCGGPDPADCKAAFALLHVRSTASAYFEDVWGWVADHGMDGTAPTQNIAVGRGALIESTAASWFIGTAFEHATMYQYSLNNAANVYIGFQQSENPYWQGDGTPEPAPAPWTVNATYGDPTFSNCASQGQAGNPQCFRAWANHMSGSSDVVIHGSAMWVFFNTMNDNSWTDADCGSTGGICQLNMAFVSGAASTFWYSLGSKSTTNIVYDATGSTATVAAMINNPGGWGSQGAIVAAYLRDSGVASAQ